MSKYILKVIEPRRYRKKGESVLILEMTVVQRGMIHLSAHKSRSAKVKGVFFSHYFNIS